MKTFNDKFYEVILPLAKTETLAKMQTLVNRKKLFLVDQTSVNKVPTI
jgi:hypothetical protein